MNNKRETEHIRLGRQELLDLAGTISPLESDIPVSEDDAEEVIIVDGELE